MTILWYGTLTFVAGVIALFIGLSFTNLPSVADLENPKSEEASEVYGANGEVLGRFYTENRVPINFSDLSPHLVSALVATEDVRYFGHCGIDFKALGRVAVKTVGMGDASSGGASTITQQLAKLLFTGIKAESASFPVRVVQKLKEWIIAVRLERKYTKEEIIALYFNKFNFINGAYGIKAASEIYFGKPQDSLSVTEAALLVGMLKNPSLYNPLRFPERVKKRRMVVLKQMEKNNALSAAEYNKLKEDPLGINFTRQSHMDGLAPYFRMELAQDVKRILTERKDGKTYDIYRDGLKIYTTIDPLMQRIAEEEMTAHMARVQKEFFRTWSKLDPWTYNSGSDLEIPVAYRQESLNKIVRGSDRYQGLREKYLVELINQINENSDLVFHEDDREVERIVAESNKSGVIEDLLQRNMIDSKLAAQYRAVLKSSLFPALKQQWEKLQKESKKAFDKPVKMRVFAYNAEMERDTVMSPLDSIRYHRMFLQTGILAVDPLTGHVKVWIGGINHKYFQYDHTRINRQVGSTFKPFIYTTAIAMQSFSPCYQVYDLPITIQPGDGDFGLIKSWTPSNAEGGYSGRLMTLKEGLKQSKNTVSVHLMKQLGSTKPVRELIDKMGIDKDARYPNGRLRVPESPSICLGATDLSVMEMTGAYSTFANNGTYIRPTYLLRIEDKAGRVIYEDIPDEKAAVNPKPNFVMVEMLRYSGGLGGSLKSDVGGKTGTTNDYVDGWFMGVTPGLVVGTWVGGEDRWMRFRSIGYGQGSYMAKPFFKRFMTRLEGTPGADYDASKRFFRPAGDLEIELDCNLYRGGNIPLDGDNGFGDEFGEDMFEGGDF